MEDRKGSGFFIFIFILIWYDGQKIIKKERSEGERCKVGKMKWDEKDEKWKKMMMMMKEKEQKRVSWSG